MIAGHNRLGSTSKCAFQNTIVRLVLDYGKLCGMTRIQRNSHRLRGRLVQSDVRREVCRSDLRPAQLPEVEPKTCNADVAIAEARYRAAVRERIGFPPKDAKRLFAQADAQIDEFIRL